MVAKKSRVLTHQVNHRVNYTFEQALEQMEQLFPRFYTKGINELETCYSGLPIIKNLAKALLSPESKEVLDRSPRFLEIPGK